QFLLRGAGSLQGVEVRTVVNLIEKLPLLHELVVMYNELHHGPLHERSHADEVREHLGVVGSWIVRRGAQHDDAFDQRSGNDRYTDRLADDAAYVKHEFPT